MSLIELNDSNFDSEIAGDQPVLVDFWAEWCQPCKMLMPTIEKVATRYEGKAKIGKVNIDDSRETAMKFNIQSIPTLLLFKNGEVKQQFVGLVDEEKIATAIDDQM